jgi:hypothetical protein
MTTIAITMACLAVCALLVWGWLVSISRVRADGRAELLEQKRATASMLEAFALANEANGDHFTAAAFRSAAEYVWSGVLPEDMTALRNETRRHERDREKAKQAN